MRQRYTRGSLFALAGAGAAALAFRRARGSGVGAPAGPAPTRFRARSTFGAPSAHGWGASWVPLQSPTRLAESNGAILNVPHGHHATAPDQPIPVQLLDHVHTDGQQILQFHTTNRTLRPGVMLRAIDPFTFAAVTIEHDRLVVAAYSFDGRRVAATGGTAALAENREHVLEVRYQGGQVWARAWPRATSTPDWQVRGAIAAQPGNPGIVAVHPVNLQACALTVSDHVVATDEQFTATTPTCPVLVSGIPQHLAGGGFDVITRAWSAYPARARFEWSADGRTFERGREHVLDEPPFTMRNRVTTHGDLFWRVRLRSLPGQAEAVTPVMHVPVAGARGPLRLLAASCYKLIGPRRNMGYVRLRDSSRQPPALLVFQGDLGYAGNTSDACYSRSADFYAERFLRCMADPGFTALRRTVPVWFTMDDHDYGPDNNADRTTVLPWTWRAWDAVTANPGAADYFDTRIQDIHILTLDGRRYSDPVTLPNTPDKTKLGHAQRSWMERILRTSSASMFVIFSADIFGTRETPKSGHLVDDCFIFGWPDEYRWAMTLFMDVQLRGKRVLIVSGDCHSLRIDEHPDPLDRPEAANMRVTEFICSGIRAELWSGTASSDTTVDRSRYRLGESGAGSVEIGPPGDGARSVTLRAITADQRLPFDAWPPLVLPFAPG